jgi:hypothetical protein
MMVEKAAVGRGRREKEGEEAGQYAWLIKQQNEALTSLTRVTLLASSLSP